MEARRSACLLVVLVKGVLLVKGVHGNFQCGRIPGTILPWMPLYLCNPPGPAARSFRDLRVWRKAHALALPVYAFTAGFPRQEASAWRYRWAKPLPSPRLHTPLRRILA